MSMNMSLFLAILGVAAASLEAMKSASVSASIERKKTGMLSLKSVRSKSLTLELLNNLPGAEVQSKPVADKVRKKYKSASKKRWKRNLKSPRSPRPSEKDSYLEEAVLVQQIVSKRPDDCPLGKLSSKKKIS